MSAEAAKEKLRRIEAERERKRRRQRIMKIVRDRIRSKILKDQEEDAASAAATPTVTALEICTERKRRPAVEESPDSPLLNLIEKPGHSPAAQYQASTPPKVFHRREKQVRLKTANFS